MDQFMREKKINKWNNIIMECHHRIYTDKSLQHSDILLNSGRANVDQTLVVCYHAHCSLAYMGSLLIRVVL